MADRLAININPETRASLQAYARSHGCTVTEAVRRAASVLALLDVETLNGNRFAVIDNNRKALKILDMRGDQPPTPDLETKP